MTLTIADIVQHIDRDKGWDTVRLSGEESAFLREWIIRCCNEVDDLRAENERLQGELNKPLRRELFMIRRARCFLLHLGHHHLWGTGRLYCSRCLEWR